MEKLLTIKEAASFLNVSEISLRRWTNSGRLKCYRVGGKKERRFELRELQNFLCCDTPPIPLHISDLEVTRSDHIAHFYEQVEEGLDEGISYLAKGLSRGEQIFVISTEDRIPKILDGLWGSGVQVNKLLAEGTITTHTGLTDVAKQLHFMNDSIQCMQSTKGFRLLGDMAWALERGWSLKDMQTLENNTNQFLSCNKALVFCQYDICQFGADAAIMALETHNISLCRGQLKESPYFVGATK